MGELDEQFGPGADSASIEPKLTQEFLDDWHKKYMARMIDRAGLSEEQAKYALDAGMGEYDYSDSPEGAADMEMSYWGD